MFHSCVEMAIRFFCLTAFGIDSQQCKFRTRSVEAENGSIVRMAARIRRWNRSRRGGVELVFLTLICAPHALAIMLVAIRGGRCVVAGRGRGSRFGF